MSELRLTLPPNVDASEATLLLCMTLYKSGRLSLGKAAELAGRPVPAFMDLLGRYDIPVFDYSGDELEQDLRDLDAFDEDAESSPQHP